jgi:hypothetical protein
MTLTRVSVRWLRTGVTYQPLGMELVMRRSAMVSGQLKLSALAPGAARKSEANAATMPQTRLRMLKSPASDAPSRREHGR